MKRGITYLLTLTSISLLYFGSLYFMSGSSSQYFKNEKSDLTNRENDVQVPLSSIEHENRIEYSSACKNMPLEADKEKAVIVVLVRNNELVPMRRTIREFEE